MPKRPNPFGDSSPLQYKSHIGKKEVDMGVSNNMDTVYEKTKSMLFSGARRSTTMGTCTTKVVAQQDENMNLDYSLAQPLPKPSTGQLRLDSKGQLCTNGIQPNLLEKNDFTFSAVPMELDRPTSVPALSRGQMQLSSSGKLCSGVTVDSSVPQFGRITTCRTCNRMCQHGVQMCNFCDKVTCRTCTRQCFNCQGLFCQMCSTIDYNDSCERAVCLHCTS